MAEFLLGVLLFIGPLSVVAIIVTIGVLVYVHEIKGNPQRHKGYRQDTW